MPEQPANNPSSKDIVVNSTDATIEGSHHPSLGQRVGNLFRSGTKEGGALPSSELATSDRNWLAGNRVTTALWSAGEHFLNNFDPRDKNLKTWAGGVAGGITATVGIAEFGATLGVTPIARALTTTAVLVTSRYLWEGLHHQYVKSAVQGFDQQDNIYNEVLALEKTIAGQKLKGEEFKTTYSGELQKIINKYQLDTNKDSQEVFYKLLQLGTDYADVSKVARSLASGLAAGSIVGSMGEIGVRAMTGAHGTLADVVSQGTGLHTPEIPNPDIGGKIGGTVEGLKNVLPNISAPDIHLPEIPNPDIGGKINSAIEGIRSHLPGVSSPDAAITGQDTLVSSPDLGQTEIPSPEVATPIGPEIISTPVVEVGPNPLAEVVGEHLNQTNIAADEALRIAGLDPSQLSESAYEHVRYAVQTQIEAEANNVFATTAGLDPSHFDPSQLSGETLDNGKQAFSNLLSDPSQHQELVNKAQDAVDQYLKAQQAIVEQVHTDLLPDGFKEVIIPRGTTVGQMLVENGQNLTWGAADAELLGAHVAANYETLNEMWANMASSGNLPEGFHYPVDLSNLSDIVEKAKNGDAVALQQLKDALHWIPAKEKFRILSKAGVGQVLKALR